MWPKMQIDCSKLDLHGQFNNNDFPSVDIYRLPSPLMPSKDAKFSSDYLPQDQMGAGVDGST